MKTFTAEGTATSILSAENTSDADQLTNELAGETAGEIARALGLYGNTVQYQLLKLESGGVLYSKLKGRVRLFGLNPRYPFKKELEAINDPAEREALYEKLVAQLYDRGKAINMAAHLEIDAVIDPADTRKWIIRGLESASPRGPGQGGHNYVDPW